MWTRSRQKFEWLLLSGPSPLASAASWSASSDPPVWSRSPQTFSWVNSDPKCVNKYDGPVFPKDSVKHCVVELAVLTEKDPLFVFYPHLPVSLVPQSTYITTLPHSPGWWWWESRGSHSNRLVPRRLQSRRSTWGRISTLSHTRFNCRTFRHLELLGIWIISLQYWVNEVNWANGEYQVKDVHMLCIIDLYYF